MTASPLVGDHQLGVAAVLALWVATLASCSSPARLELTVTDAATGVAVPARVELLDANGVAWVPEGTVRVARECALPPFPGPLQDATSHYGSVFNGATGTTQFYVAGPVSFELPPGTYDLRVFLGIEYRVARRRIEIAGEGSRALTVAMRRWINMPARGWHSADGHLHITRLTREDDLAIGKMMRAEDLHVANLLQMGTQKQFGVTPQYGFGDPAVHREGATLVISGQEHPRNHVWGHTVILGAREPIDFRDQYVNNELFWREARRLGGLAGYAHFGVGSARDGLMVDGPGELITFLEVLQFELAYYEIWYELLNLGIPLVPTAGTDFPCGYAGLPGRERFYTRVDGELGRESWLAGIDAGRTFVTNGPMLELELAGAGIGDTLALAEPVEVTITGRVRFDPDRDEIQRVELVHNGEVESVATAKKPGDWHFEITRQLAQTGWWALRVSGRKRDEILFPVESGWDRFFFEEIDARVSGGSSTREIRDFRARHRDHPSAAHTAPILVTVAGTPSLAEQPRARALARVVLERLDLLDDRLGEYHLVSQMLRTLTYSDGVPAGVVRNNRDAIDRAVGAARHHYRRIADGD